MDRRQFCQKVIGCGIAVTVSSSVAFGLPPKTTQTTVAKATADQKLEWFRNLKQAHRQSIQTDKPMLIVFGGSGCHWCTKMDQEALSDPRLIAKIKRDYIPVHLDFQADNKVATILEVEVLPTVVILSPEADLLHKQAGYQDFNKFMKTLQTAETRRKEIVQVQNREPAR